MLWRIKRFIRRIKNLIRWFPIIWEDENWDYYHIYEVLKYKLLFTAEHIHEYGHHVNSKHDVNRIMLCIRLIKKVQNEEYMEVLINDDNLTAEKINTAYNRQNKARKLLFRILEQNLEQWWD